MAEHNSYLLYKHDSHRLLYWMINASNSIITSSPSPPFPDAHVNTTGQLEITEFVPMCKLIADNISPIPPAVYRLFHSVIAERTGTHLQFRKMASKKRDLEFEKRNSVHKRFIDTLTEAFWALGGKSWTEKQGSSNGTVDREDEEDEDEAIFGKNRFSTFDSNEPSIEDSHQPTTTDKSDSSRPKRRQKKCAMIKSNKGKRGKTSNGKGQSVVESGETKLYEPPLESYRIVEDEGGLITDYFMAIFSVLDEIVELRHYIQDTWSEVANGHLNSACAGAISNVAIAMIKQAESVISTDFPGRESYETVMRAITHGDLENAGAGFTLALHEFDAAGTSSAEPQQVKIDVKEEFLIHAYLDMLDFITDFQATRSGKPTEAMLSTIRDWDPNLNLQKTTKEQRIKWRRAYTISWLYDLVNLFSSVVVQSNILQGQNMKLEDVDWSISGPWSKHRRLFGLNEFAGVITSLAVQKQGTDVRQKIPLHLVFQMQCIADSMAVSRGWLVSTFDGHVLSPPKDFRARRDVDMFLDRENQRIGHGYCPAVDILKQCMEADAQLHNEPRRHENCFALLDESLEDFLDYLGESKYCHGLRDIPPSRFSNTNPNGLWEYSPFLCGVGLLEALELVYGLIFTIWDHIPEPICILHLHRMLVERGYLDRQIGLWTSLETIFPTAFFDGGEIPKTNFLEAFVAHGANTDTRKEVSKRRALKNKIRRGARSHAGLLNFNLDVNRFFKQKLIVGLYREAGWVPDRIPEGAISPHTALALVRLTDEAARSKQPAESQGIPDNGTLGERAEESGITDDTIRMVLSAMEESRLKDEVPESVAAKLKDLYDVPPFPDAQQPHRGTSKGSPSGRALLEILKLDIIQEINGCGGGGPPTASLNYTWVTVMLMTLFTQMERELEQLRNPSWVEIYGGSGDGPGALAKRARLTVRALRGTDTELLTVMAHVFEANRGGFINFIYWDGLVPLGAASLEENSCTVM